MSETGRGAGPGGDELIMDSGGDGVFIEADYTVGITEGPHGKEGAGGETGEQMDLPGCRG